MNPCRAFGLHETSDSGQHPGLPHGRWVHVNAEHTCRNEAAGDPLGCGAGHIGGEGYTEGRSARRCDRSVIVCAWLAVATFLGGWGGGGGGDRSPARPPKRTRRAAASSPAGTKVRVWPTRRRSHPLSAAVGTCAGRMRNTKEMLLEPSSTKFRNAFSFLCKRAVCVDFAIQDLFLIHQRIQTCMRKTDVVHDVLIAAFESRFDHIYLPPFPALFV
jgi:hypothetical protein